MAPDYPRPRLDASVLRDLIAVLLVVIGAAGLAVAAFATDWRLGVAYLSAATVSAGVYLGYER